MKQGTVISSSVEPDWADESEGSSITVDGHERTVVDHYGVLTEVPLPGVPTRFNYVDVPSIVVQVSRADLVLQDDESRMVVGPYRISIGVGEQFDANLPDVASLEAFATRISDAAAEIRALIDREEATVSAVDVAADQTSRAGSHS